MAYRFEAISIRKNFQFNFLYEGAMRDGFTAEYYAEIRAELERYLANRPKGSMKKRAEDLLAAVNAPGGWLTRPAAEEVA